MIQTAEWKRRRLKKKVIKEDLQLKKTIFGIRRDYPAFYVDLNLNVIINLGDFPLNITYKDLIYHVMKGDLCERICYLIKVKSNKPIKCKTRYEDCTPAITAMRMLRRLGFKPRFQYFNEYEEAEAE